MYESRNGNDDSALLKASENIIYYFLFLFSFYSHVTSKKEISPLMSYVFKKETDREEV
jgi:hypothetical protein